MNCSPHLKRQIVLSFLIFAVAVLPFLRAVHYGLVNCDDYQYVLTVTEQDRGVFSAANSTWMPLTWLSYKTDLSVAKAFGLDRYHVMHAQNVFWHACNALLLFFLLSALAPGKMCLAFAGSLLWAMHPLRVESVVWIASRKDVLSLFWLLLSLLAWVRRKLWLSYFLFLVAATAKQSVMTYPALVAILDCFVLRQKFSWRRYVPAIALAFAVAVIAYMAQNNDGGCATMAVVPLWWRVLNAATAIGVYLGNTVCPTGLAPQCLAAWPDLPKGMVLYIPIFILAVSLGYGFWRMSRQWPVCRLFLGGMLFFGIGLIPMLGIVGFGYHAYADRFTYLPSIGFSLVLLGIGNRLSSLVFVIMSGVLGFFASCQTAYWENDEKLWSRALEVHGDDDWHAHRNLGLYYYEFPHDVDQCIRHFRKVLETKDPAKSDACLLPYLFALCEKGPEYREEARGVYYDISAWNSRMVRSVVGDDAEGVTFTEYRVARILFLYGDPELREEALKDAAVMAKAKPDNHFVKYMKYVLGQSSASELKTDSLKNYIRFSFLLPARQ